MKSREELQASMEAGLAAGQEKIEAMKVKMAEAGDDVSADATDALAEAEKAWEVGKVKLDELAAASDETFEELRASAEENWDEISASMEAGWASVSEKFKNLFS